MKELLKMYSEVFIGVVSLCAIFIIYTVFRYIVTVCERKREERKKDWKSETIREHYIIKNKKISVIIFSVVTVFFGICAVFCYLTVFMDLSITCNMEADAWCIYLFAAFTLVGIIGILNTVIWKLEVNEQEITWRSTFGIVRKFRFENITRCERMIYSIRVYVNGKKMFHIDNNINCEEFIKDVERHGVPVEYYFMKKCKER